MPYPEDNNSFTQPSTSLFKKISHNKRYIWTFLSVFLLLAIPLTVFTVLQIRDLRSSAASAPPCYDFDGDHLVTEKDVTIVQNNYFSGNLIYDINKDGKVNTTDIIAEAQHNGEKCLAFINDFTVNRETAATITPGSSVTLRWATSYTDPNSVAISWISGSLPASGSYTVSPTTTTTYTLRATNTATTNFPTQSVTVTVVAPTTPTTPSPTVDLKVNGFNGPISIPINTAAKLTWLVSNATSCSASGDWTGSKNTSGGSESTGSLTLKKTYFLSCTGAGGTKSDSVTVNISTPTSSPTVDIKANDYNGPITIATNTSANLTWLVSNATSCTASGDWTGSKSIGGGSESTGSLTLKKTYTLSCTGSGGTATDSVIVYVAEPTSTALLPTVALTADNLSLDYSTATTLRWSVTNATSCTASGGWTGSKSTSGGSESTGKLTSKKTYVLTCSSSSGTKVASITVNVNPQSTIPPTVDIKANNSNGPITISLNSSVNLSWTATNATSCTASGDWSEGRSNTVGTVTATNITSNKTYILTCTSSDGSTAKDAVTVSVPTVNIKAKPAGGVAVDGPITIPNNSSISVTWTSSKVTDCSVSPLGWTGTSGSQSVFNMTFGRTFTVNCTGIYGPVSDKVIVNVSSISLEGDKKTSGSDALEPTVSLTASPTSIQYGASVLLTWASTNANKVTISGFTDPVCTSTSLSCISGRKIIKPEKNTTYTAVATSSDGSSDSVSVSVAVSCIGTPIVEPNSTLKSANSPMIIKVKGMSNCKSSDRATISLWKDQKMLSDSQRRCYFSVTTGECTISITAPAIAGDYAALATITSDLKSNFAGFRVTDPCSGIPNVVITNNQYPNPREEVTVTISGFSNCSRYDNATLWYKAVNNNWIVLGACQLISNNKCDVKFVAPSIIANYDLQAFVIKSDNITFGPAKIFPGILMVKDYVDPIVYTPPPGSDPSYDSSLPDDSRDLMETYLKQLPARTYRIPNYISDYGSLEFREYVGQNDCPRDSQGNYIVRRSGCWSFVDYNRGAFLYGLAGPESRWHRLAYNATACEGPCYGLYQFSDGTWKSNNNSRLNRSNSTLDDPNWRDPYAQMKTVMFIIEHGGRLEYFQNWTADLINYSSETSKWWINNVYEYEH